MDEKKMAAREVRIARMLEIGEPVDVRAAELMQQDPRLGRGKALVKAARQLANERAGDDY